MNVALASKIAFNAFFDRCRRFQQRDHDGLAAYMVLQFLPDDPLTDPSEVALWCCDSSLENECQYLGYWIGTDERNEYFDVSYGVVWNDEDNTPSKSAKLYRLATVAAVRQRLAAMDFKEGGDCVGWHLLHDREDYESVDEFLADIEGAQEVVLRDMASRFWSLVEKTLPAVKKANLEIVGKKDS